MIDQPHPDNCTCHQCKHGDEDACAILRLILDEKDEERRLLLEDGAVGVPIEVLVELEDDLYPDLRVEEDEEE